MNIVVNHSYGFWSCCSVRLYRIIEFINNKNTLPENVDSSSQFSWYKINNSDDITYDYFQHYNNINININYKYPINYNWDHQFNNYSKLEYNKICPIVEKYFSPSSEIKQIINDIELKYYINYNLKKNNINTKIRLNYNINNEDKLNNYEEKLNNYEEKMSNYEEKLNNYEEKMSNYEEKLNNYEEKLNNYEEKLNNYNNICVLFYRGNDKNTETKICGYNEYIEKANIILNENPNIQFLIQSDETEFIEQMTLLYPNNSFYFKDEIRHIKKCNSTVDIVMKDKNNLFSKYYLAITIIMSKCNYIVCGSGNCSIWIMLYRGNSRNVYQNLNGEWIK